MTVINTRNAETINITSNGQVNVAAYTTANVNVTPTLCIQKTKDANGKVVNGSTVIDLDGATDVGDYALAYAYNGVTFPANTSIDLSSLTTVSGNTACQQMFQNCTGIISVDLSSLTTVSGQNCCTNMFNKCTGITGALNLSNLTTVSSQNGCSSMFGYCKEITSIDLSSLTTISSQNGCANMFMVCWGVTSVNLPSLTTISGQTACKEMFQNCISLTSLSFPALTSTSFGSYTSQFNNMLFGVTGCTVHFPSNLQSVIGSWASVTAGFGGTNTTVLFDLPATE